MKKTTIAVLTLLILSFSTYEGHAQYDYSDELYYDHPLTYELGASAGIMNCFTDLGGRKGGGKDYYKDFSLNNSQIAGSVFFSAYYKYAIGLRAEATFGRVKAQDNSLETVRSTTFGRYERNLSFRSNIIEVMLALELHPLYFRTYREGKKIPRLSPYLVGGIGFYSFNPQAILDGKWIDLQPLRTEGQGFAEYPDRKRYKLKQFNYPLGIGIKYKATPLCNISLEVVSRILSTDYLDDVSTEYIDPSVYYRYFTGTKLSNALLLHDRHAELDPTHVTKPREPRGNPGKNDSYYTINLKFALLF